jgi:hypothetical protein
MMVAERCVGRSHSAGETGETQRRVPEGAKTHAESPALQEFACPQLAGMSSTAAEATWALALGLTIRGLPSGTWRV